MIFNIKEMKITNKIFADNCIVYEKNLFHLYKEITNNILNDTMIEARELEGEDVSYLIGELNSYWLTIFDKLNEAFATAVNALNSGVKEEDFLIIIEDELLFIDVDFTLERLKIDYNILESSLEAVYTFFYELWCLFSVKMKTITEIKAVSVLNDKLRIMIR